MKALSKIEKQLNKNSQEPVIALWNRMRKAVAECYRVDEFANIRSVAEIMRCALIQAKRGPEIIRQVVEIKLRAERRAGELLRKQLKNPGGRPEKNRSKGTTSFCAGQSGLVTHPPSLKDLGISKDQSSKWQRIASIPEEKFEQFLVNKEELSSARAVSLARNLEREKRREEAKALPFPQGEYRVILADPPWRYSNIGLRGSAESHYPTMSLEEICGLDVPSLAHENSVLFLWVPSPFLQEGLQVCKEWGYGYKTNFVWVKDRKTYGKLGFYLYSQHEFLLVSIRGSCLPAKEGLVASLISAPRKKHSQKPEIVYEIIEGMYGPPYLELFARSTRNGWTSWGNEL